jgi:hypothetical protein
MAAGNFLSQAFCQFILENQGDGDVAMCLGSMAQKLPL